MHETRKLPARIGAVPMPIVKPDPIGADVEDASAADQPFLSLEPDELVRPELRPDIRPPVKRPPIRVPPLRKCRTNLREGCYRLSFVPAGSPFWGTRYRGTLRVEKVEAGYRISGDLYRYRLFDSIVLQPPVPFERERLGRLRPRDLEALLGDGTVSDAPGDIPVYKREDYFSYLEGTDAQMIGFAPVGTDCGFTLWFDEYEYNHPASGFSGTFASTPARSVRFLLKKTQGPHRYEGTAFEGSTNIGSVTIQHVSKSVRKATLVMHTLEGAQAPAAVDGEDFRSVMKTANWDLRVVDGGEVPMPDTITGQSPTSCWSEQNLHRLMESVPGHHPGDLDQVWRSHLLAVPAKLGCGRGVVYDHPGGDLNSIAREGSATFSHDGYPAPNSNFGAAEGEQQRNVPRAFLRSAAHEVGHAFNQIHQSFEGGDDNSIMMVTPSVAGVIAANGGTFPDDIELAFNDTVRRHLMHLPDPAVRPGAMDFFGAAVNAPEPADISTMRDLEVEVAATSDRVRLGEPVNVSWRLTNRGSAPAPVPSELDPRALVSRVSVTGPDGEVTFMRPPDLHLCHPVPLASLAPGESLEHEANVFYGRDGFAFTQPGRHTVTVIVLWEVAGQNVLAQGSADVWVSYPVSQDDNEVAGLLLDPDVGLAIATDGTVLSEHARDSIRAAAETSESHPACAALERLGLAG